LPLSQPVIVNLLSDPLPDGTPRVLQATLANLSGRGMRIMLEHPLPLDTAIRVDFRWESEDALMLGEVVYCIPEGELFAVGLELHHSLVHLTSLQGLMDNLLEEQPDRTPEPAPVSKTAAEVMNHRPAVSRYLRRKR